MSLIAPKSVEKWLDANQEQILRVQSLLATPLPNDPAMLDNMLRDIDSEYESMNSLFADALTLYDAGKRKALRGRERGVTDLDREIEMRAETINERRLVVTLEGIVEAVKSRLMLGMSLRKSYVGEGHAGHRSET